MSSKPLNILVYCCKNSLRFDSVSELLLKLIGKSKYTITALDETQPWQRYCSLVVVAIHPQDIPFSATGQLRKFNRDGGKILSLGGYFTSLLPLDSFREPPGPCLDELCSTPSQLPIGQGKEKSFIVLPVSALNEHSTLTKALGELGIISEKECSMDLHPLEVYSRSSIILDKFIDSVKQQVPTLDHNVVKIKMPSSDESVPVIKKSIKETDFFKYINDAGSFPEIFIKSKTVTSTQDLLWSNRILSSAAESVAILADVQIKGKGRGANQWISPLGAMSLSFHFTITETSQITRKLPFLQYIAALATVDAILEVTEMPHLPVRIKWPNDIYTSNGIKIGGVLVNCGTNRNSTNLCVGIGLNVNNADPTISISNLSGRDVSVVQLASRICSFFFNEILIFNELGHEQFIDRFCRVWLHQDKKVKISLGRISCDAIIKSIDKDGFLSVQNVSNGDFVSVQPDGNSFDMMENLIAVKKS